MYGSLAACRAAAAMLVALFHLGGTFAQDKYFGFKALDGPFAWADAGAEFFFVLSGFLITFMHRRDVGQPQALPHYVSKRFVRIFPTYWLVCAAVCLAALAVPSLRAALPSDVAVFVKALLLVPQDPAVVGGTGSPILFVAWTMQYEMLFYLVVACFIASRAAGMMAVVALAAVHMGCRFGSAGTDACGFPQSFFASNLVLLFGMGVISAHVALGRRKLARPLAVGIAGAIAFVAFGAFEAWHGRDPWGLDRRLVYGVLSSVLIVGLVQAEDAGKLNALKGRWTALLGDSSYALYLLHIPLISMLCKLALHVGVSKPVALVVLFAGIFLTCVAVALVFHLAVERPMLAWLRRFTRKRRGVAPVAHHGVGLQ